MYSKIRAAICLAALCIVASIAAQAQGYWTQVQGTATQIAVGSMNNIWVINAAGQTYKYDGSGGWIQIHGTTLTQIIACGDYAVFGVTSSNQVWRTTCCRERGLTRALPQRRSTRAGRTSLGVSPWTAGSCDSIPTAPPITSRRPSRRFPCHTTDTFGGLPRMGMFIPSTIRPNNLNKDLNKTRVPSPRFRWDSGARSLVSIRPVTSIWVLSGGGKCRANCRRSWWLRPC